MKEVDKIIYQYNDTYTRMYQGSVLEYQRKIDYLSFTAIEDSTIGTKITGTISPAPNVEYSKDKNSWSDLTANTVSLSAGETIYVRGNNPNSFSIDANNYLKFTMTGSINAGGDITTLVNRIGGVLTIPSAGYFINLFNSLAALKSVPKLPSINLTRNCYRNMLRHTGITESPELPATTLADYCYCDMFSGCSNLVVAPVLPAKILTTFCYWHLFVGCQKIKYVKCLAEDISADSCTKDWLFNAPTTGTFVKSSNMTGWTTGTSGIPVGWTVENE